jgi:hypothetical protein
MKRNLIKNDKEIYYFKDGKKILEVHSNISGNVSNIWGDVSGIRGDLDDCDITNKERKKGINIKNLIK